MDVKNIKAPDDLKNDVIRQMELELEKSNVKLNKKDLDSVHHLCKKPYLEKKKSFKIPIGIVALLFIVIFSGFAYDYFSAIKGDDLAFSTEYKGEGIVHIDVENKSHKELKFTRGVLKTFQDNEELVYINEKGEKDLPCVNVDMPTIKGGEKGTIIIDLREIDYKKLEEPIVFNDGFVFVLTNDKYQSGQNWMTAIRFNNEIRGSSSSKVKPLELNKEDNTNLDYIKEIKENYTIKNPLSEIIITFEYNSSMENPRISLGADEGAEIYAMADGVVIRPEYNRYTGRTVIINHSDDFVTEYWHCQEILVENGQYVKAGDVIAKVGATGRATGPHLSLVGKYKNEYINSSLLLSVSEE